jgi:hypothetical protein
MYLFYTCKYVRKTFAYGGLTVNRSNGYFMLDTEYTQYRGLIDFLYYMDEFNKFDHI